MFILKLLTMLFTTLDIVRREDDMPESDSRVATRIDPGSGQKVSNMNYFLLPLKLFLITKYFHCQVEQPVLVILKQMLPVYQQLCSQYNNDPDLTEAVCSNLKQGVATLQDDIRPLTQEVGSTLHYIIHYTHHHCTLHRRC